MSGPSNWSGVLSVQAIETPPILNANTIWADLSMSGSIRMEVRYYLEWRFDCLRKRNAILNLAQVFPEDISNV